MGWFGGGSGKEGGGEDEPKCSACGGGGEQWYGQVEKVDGQNVKVYETCRGCGGSGSAK